MYIANMTTDRQAADMYQTETKKSHFLDSFLKSKKFSEGFKTNFLL